MTRSIIIVASLLVATPALAQNGAKCTNPQAVCAVQHGGRCDPKTGRWGIGGYEYGGNHHGWLECVTPPDPNA